MKEIIKEHIERINLHDSHIQKIERTGGNMIWTLDWAKLENYAESHVHESIVLGKCELVFEGFTDERLLVDYSGIPGKEKMASREIDFDPNYFESWLILVNKVEAPNRFCINGLIDFEGNSPWLNWHFSFSGFQLSWNKYITVDEWRRGKIVD
jgi:hypothetical protein